VICAYDYRDPTAASPRVREKAFSWTSRRIEELSAGGGGSVVSGLRIGIPVEYFPRELTEEIVGNVREVVEALKMKGGKIVPVRLPCTRYALSCYYVLASAEASSNLARYDGVEYGGFILCLYCI